MAGVDAVSPGERFNALSAGVAQIGDGPGALRADTRESAVERPGRGNRSFRTYAGCDFALEVIHGRWSLTC